MTVVEQVPPASALSLWNDAAPFSMLISNEIDRRWPDGPSLVDSMCHYALAPGGKLVRPMLVLDSALAVGGDLSCVIPAAVGAECGHVASLIHDDIIDGDDLRRGRPSVQHKYGVADAIVAGDALIFDLFAALAECHSAGAPGHRVVAALEAVARAGLDLCRGQSLESELTRNPRFDADAYLTVARLKTASFFRGACESGALLGGGSEAAVQALSTYGDLLGTAFQIHDDLLTYISDSQITGKPKTSDVENGRLTLPVILAYESALHWERELIERALCGQDEPVHALANLTEVIERTGALSAAKQRADDLAGQARQALAALPWTASRDRLDGFAALAIKRDR
jgi:geranylgeranyl diphosphate synthase, type I